jgi:type IV pilus assembly protein PilV
MHRHPSVSRGTTLIEAMAALVVFTIGILGVMQMNVLASRQNTLARGEATASKIARDLAYAFDRLPYNHPFFSTYPDTGYIDPKTADFTDFTKPLGLVKLQDAPTLSSAQNGRPLMGSAQAMVTVEAGNTNVSGFGTYEVAWRAAPLMNPEDAPGKPPMARVIVIMVRFKSVANTYRQVNVYTVKYNPEAVIDANALIQEI